MILMNENTFKGNKKFNDNLSHITKVYLEQIEQLHSKFENN